MNGDEFLLSELKSGVDNYLCGEQSIILGTQPLDVDLKAASDNRGNVCFEIFLQTS